VFYEHHAMILTRGVRPARLWSSLQANSVSAISALITARLQVRRESTAVNATEQPDVPADAVMRAKAVAAAERRKLRKQHQVKKPAKYDAIQPAVVPSTSAVGSNQTAGAAKSGSGEVPSPLQDVISQSQLSDATKSALLQISGEKTMSAQEKLKARLRAIAKQYQQHPADVGSCEVQVACLTERIRNLREHMRTHHKDVHRKRFLDKFTHRRRFLLLYLRRSNFKAYERLMTDCGITEKELYSVGKMSGRMYQVNRYGER